MKIIYRNRMRDLRVKHGYTQDVISNMLHVTQRTYSHYERGRRRIPIEIMIEIASLYHTSLDYLVGITDNPIPYAGSVRNKKEPE